MRRLNLIEIIVIVVVLGIGLAMALPYLLQSRESSRSVLCQRNLQKFVEAMNHYQAAHKGQMPYATMRGSQLPHEKRLAWTVPLYLSLKPNSNHNFDPAKAWNVDPNRSPELNGDSIRRVSLFRCPADTTDSPVDEIQFSSFVGMAGLGRDAITQSELTPQSGFWSYNRQPNLTDISDGTRFSICILETSRDNGAWTAGGRPTLARGPPRQGDVARLRWAVRRAS